MEKFEDNLTFEDIINQTFKKVKVGSTITGTIVEINGKGEIFVDIGYKADGIIPRNEYFSEKGLEPADEYKVGDKIPLKKLLYEMIVNSDNTATNILAEALGGRKIYRKYFEKYTKTTLPDEFYTENIISASYRLDVLKYLYKNSNIYKELIENMKKSSFGKYLKKYISSCEIAHKYGSYKGNIHDYGIVYGKKTYFIGIFTKNIENAEELIATISKEIFEIE